MSGSRLNDVSWWRLDSRRGPVLTDLESLEKGDMALAVASVAGQRLGFLFCCGGAKGTDLKTLWSGVIAEKGSAE